MWIRNLQAIEAKNVLLRVFIKRKVI